VRAPLSTAHRLAPVGVLILVALAAGAAAVADHSPRPAGRSVTAPASRAHGARVARAHGTPAAHVRRRALRRSLEQRLSVDQLAGQRIIYAYAGLEPPPALLAAIRAGEAAGVIFFAPNISSTTQIQAVIAELQRAGAASPVHAPLLMLTDQEGGEVRRLPGAPRLSEKRIGASADAVALAGKAGAGAGQNLAGAGVNVNLAPVLDVFRRPGNFIDEFQRAYSSSPTTVARLGGAFIAAQQRTAVAATAKHFPGLGGAAQSQNTDLGPVTLDVSLGHLRTIDEAPYRSALAAGVKLVMTSWAVYPALDPRLPAGLSPTVIAGELRRRLGFRGVTITDGIAAGALTRFGSVGQRGVLAARAGADLLLCAATNVNDNTPAEGISVRRAVAVALRSRRLSRAAAQQAAARVLTLRSQAGM
jgi:beta-N-acetylhexosaminidase